MLTNAELMFSARDSLSQTRFGWSNEARSRFGILLEPQICLTSLHQSRGLESRKPLTLLT
jgi:hypothetical protein